MKRCKSQPCPGVGVGTDGAAAGDCHPAVFGHLQPGSEAILNGAWSDDQVIEGQDPKMKLLYNMNINIGSIMSLEMVLFYS